MSRVPQELASSALDERPEPTRDDVGYAMIALVGAVAWLPAIRRFIPLADDYPMAALLDHGVSKFLSTWFATNGLQRVGQLPIAWLLMHSSAYFPSVLTLVTHIVVCLLHFQVCLILFGSPPLARILGVLVAAFPWGYQAMLWVAAYSCLVSTGAFWLVFLILLRTPNNRATRLRSAVICLLTVLITSVIREDFTFAYFSFALLPCATAWPTGSTSPLRPRIRWHCLTPAAAATLFLAGFILTHRSSADLQPHFNLGSLVSPFLRQYSSFDAFGPWWSPATRALLFDQWNAGTIAALAGVLVVAIATLVALARGHNSSELVAPRASTLASRRAFLPFLIALLLGTSAVYVFAGGLSLDSRKRYGLMPIVLLGLAWLATDLVRRRSLPLNLRPSASTLVWILLAISGVSSTWLVVGVWRYEEQRSNALVAFIAANHIEGPIVISTSPDLAKAWPTMERSIGFLFDDAAVLNDGLRAQRLPPIYAGESRKPAIHIHYDRDDPRWRVVREGP